SVNFFSLKQDVEIGEESEKQAKTLPPVSNLNVGRYVTTIGQRIVQNRTLPALHYRFQIINSKDINSFGFPGGAIYVYRGLLEIAWNDDEVARILAHEVSHRASCHGTGQLSRQPAAQAPIALAAAVPAAEACKVQIAR